MGGFFLAPSEGQCPSGPKVILPDGQTNDRTTGLRELDNCKTSGDQNNTIKIDIFTFLKVHAHGFQHTTRCLHSCLDLHHLQVCEIGSIFSKYGTKICSVNSMTLLFEFQSLRNIDNLISYFKFFFPSGEVSGVNTNNLLVIEKHFSIDIAIFTTLT